MASTTTGRKNPRRMTSKTPIAGAVLAALVASVDAAAAQDPLGADTIVQFFRAASRETAWQKMGEINVVYSAEWELFNVSLAAEHRDLADLTPEELHLAAGRAEAISKMGRAMRVICAEFPRLHPDLAWMVVNPHISRCNYVSDDMAFVERHRTRILESLEVTTWGEGR